MSLRVVPQAILDLVVKSDFPCLTCLDSSPVDPILHHLTLPHGRIPAHSCVDVDGSGLSRIHVVHAAPHAEHAHASGHAPLRGAHSTAPAAPAVTAVLGTRRARTHRQHQDHTPNESLSLHDGNLSRIR